MSRRPIVRSLHIAGFILVLIAWQVPTWWTRSQRRAQNETLSNLRSLGLGVDAYRQDHRSVPAATRCADLQLALVPTYVKSATFARLCRDGWGNTLAFNFAKSPGTSAPAYVLASPGRDGLFVPLSRELLAATGAPILRPALAKELSNVGTWYDMDYILTPPGFVALAFDGQEQRHDYGRAPTWMRCLSWFAVSVWVVIVLLTDPIFRSER